MCPVSRNVWHELPKESDWYRKEFETKIHILEDCRYLVH
jgi:hypothetical protein